MRNYVIINGVNSNTIQGLAINILPPITKPMMRSQIEEIDGRDGDLVTELGYSAYDKTMEIGLWGTYDIDAIIKYFTGEGTIVFSTEADKYYYFKILNQIDYEKLLKFKKATVTFHCQPYKYPTSETPLEEQYEYVEATGTDLTLNNTEETIFNKFDLIGNTYQDSTSGKNIFNYNSSNYLENSSTTLSGTGNNFSISSTGYGTRAIFVCKIDFQTLYAYMSSSYSSSSIALYYTNNSTYENWVAFTNDRTQIISNWDITQTNSVSLSNYQNKYLWITLRGSYTDGGYSSVTYKDFILSKASVSAYEPYTGGIASPNPNYPQDIHVVSGDNEIKVEGKNLFDNANAFLFGSNNIYVASSNDYNSRGTIKVQPSTSYILSLTSGNITDGKAYFYDKDMVAISNTNAKTSFTTPSNAMYLGFYATSGNQFSGTEYAMLEQNNQATPYEPYQGASYPISLGVENLWKPIPSATKNGVTLTYNDDGSYTLNGTSTAATSFYVSASYPIGTYSLSANNSQVMLGGADYLLLETVAGGSANKTLVFSIENHSQTFDMTSPIKTLVIVISSGKTYNNFVIKPQLEKGSKVNSFSKYGTTPIEMCSIPNTDYKDTFVHEENKWYKYAMVGKAVLNGSENWMEWGGFTSNFYGSTLDNYINYNNSSGGDIRGVSNYFPVVAGTDVYKAMIGLRQVGDSLKRIYCTLSKSVATDITQFKQWFASNNTTLYYALENPTQTEITDETLIGQLNDLWENATSYKGQTNITQTNNDMPFILDVSALKDGSDHLIIDNIGTAYSNPTIDIEGTGIVDIYLNDEQIFEIDMTVQNEIIIDTEKMEAYTPDNLLANRLVTGDYSNFKLAPGENDLRFSGDLTKATVTRYIRWI